MFDSNSFQPGNLVVYPVHGIGQVLSIETQEIGGQVLQVILIQFLENKSRVAVPVEKAAKNGLRPVASQDAFQQALAILKTKQVIQKNKLLWSKRFALYENKFKSGDIILIAELVRDLNSILQQAFPSYSEQNLYKLALSRLAQEMSVIQKTDPADAIRALEEILKAA